MDGAVAVAGVSVFIAIAFQFHRPLFSVTLPSNYKPGYRYAARQRGKSGQHRAMHRLSAGSAVSRTCGSCGTDSATENNCPARIPRRVKVKKWGKSPRRCRVTCNGGKPCMLKCHVYQSMKWLASFTQVKVGWVGS